MSERSEESVELSGAAAAPLARLGIRSLPAVLTATLSKLMSDDHKQTPLEAAKRLVDEVGRRMGGSQWMEKVKEQQELWAKIRDTGGPSV
ncbi:MAG: hypothetical protein FWF01_00570 [Alphaproteobacteria bacterium]|nr:hypothetical protein [Alphaproteobacteria bacterium]